jgi:ABC-type glycerol-3-phosphate transport system substrate-binding protein
MKSLILVGIMALGLAACSGPTLNGQSDSAQLFPGEPHVTHPTGPYDNTVNSLGGRYNGSGGNG